MITFHRLMILVSKTMVRRSRSTSFISTPVRLMNSKVTPPGNGKPSTDIMEQIQAYCIRNKETITLLGFFGSLLGVGIWGTNTVMSRITKLEESSASKEKVAALEAQVASIAEIVGLKAENVSLQSFINREESIADGKASREEPAIRGSWKRW